MQLRFVKMLNKVDDRGPIWTRGRKDINIRDKMKVTADLTD